MGDAWEWELENDVKLTARIELPKRVESVWLGPRLVSRSGAGGKGADHIVELPAPKLAPKKGEAYREAPPAREAVFTFDPIGAHCTLRVDGVVVPPKVSPDEDVIASARANLPRKVLGMPLGRAIIVGGVVAGVLAIALVPPAIRGLRARAARSKIADARVETDRTDTLVAPDSSIAAHFPPDFDGSVDPQGAFISLQRSKKMETVFLVSMPRTDLDDPRDLDRIMMADLEKYVANTRPGATMSTSITNDGDCHEFKGVVSTATVSKADDKNDIPQKIVACTMLRSGRGYFFAYFVPEFNADKQGAEMQKIVDATDIFDLPTPYELGMNTNTNPNDTSQYRPVQDPFGSSTVFSAQGARTITRGSSPAPRPTFATVTRSTPPRPVPPRPAMNTPTPAATLQFNPNGSVEFAGNTADKAAALERDRRAREAAARNAQKGR